MFGFYSNCQQSSSQDLNSERYLVGFSPCDTCCHKNYYEKVTKNYGGEKFTTINWTYGSFRNIGCYFKFNYNNTSGTLFPNQTPTSFLAKLGNIHSSQSEIVHDQDIDNWDDTWIEQIKKSTQGTTLETRIFSEQFLENFNLFFELTTLGTQLYSGSWFDLRNKA